MDGFRAMALDLIRRGEVDEIEEETSSVEGAKWERMRQRMAEAGENGEIY